MLRVMINIAHHMLSQVQEEGYRRHFYSMDAPQRPGSPLTSINVRKLLPPVITIFSAPNYVERYQNKVRSVLSDLTL
jgi:hypothetical protein